MALHFSANQFETAYKPWRLGNWEISRVFPERPRPRRGPTKVIVNDRGHLLPGVPRSGSSPWGPLTQQTADANGNHKTENKNYAGGDRKTDEAQPEIPNQDLEITGEGLLSGNKVNESEEQRQEILPSAKSSGSITPASFRKAGRVISAASSKSSRKSTASSARRSSPSLSSSPNAKTKVLEEAAYLPADTIEDALLPRKPGDVLEPNSRAVAIRLVDHPAPTNCTKYVVIRPKGQAPVPASPASQTSLLPKRTKTVRKVRKIPEIEFALKWDLQDDVIEEYEVEEEAEDEDEGIEMTPPQAVKIKDSQSPRSVTSADSGIHLPKTAWQGPDSGELASKLESLKQGSANGNKSLKDKRIVSKSSESGYGTPTSMKSAASHHTAGSRHSLSSSVHKEMKTPTLNHSQKISMDSQCLSQSPGDKKCVPSVLSSKHSVPESPQNIKSPHHIEIAKPIAKPYQKPARDPLEIMETIDSVFQRVPLRETEPGQVSQPVQTTDKYCIAIGTQTEEGALVYEVGGDGQIELKHTHDHPGHLRTRSCVACEVKAMEEPTKKYVAPAEVKPPFKTGKMHPQHTNKPRYIRQSDKYKARLKTKHDPPRYWNINTLHSPFDNRHGCGKDQYPSNLRLRTTYEMNYSKPAKPHRGPIVKKLYL